MYRERDIYMYIYIYIYVNQDVDLAVRVGERGSAPKGGRRSARQVPICAVAA